MNEARAEALREWSDFDRKRHRENGEPNPLVDAWVASQTAPLCATSSGSFTCVLSAEHEGGCFMRSR
jgi:hypothetical protein